MQHKNHKKPLKHKLRRAHERAAAIFVSIGILVGCIAISQEARRLLTDLAKYQAFSLIQHSSEERETPHRLIRFDDGQRTPYMSGGDA